MQRKNNAKHDLDEETGLHQASDSTTETRAGGTAQQTDNNDVLKAISSLHAELAHLKSDICNKIEAAISEVKYTLRGEIATLRTESDTALLALKSRMSAQNQSLKELTDVANDTSDTIQVLEDKVKGLSWQVEALSEKCLNLEGCSKRQNLRVAGIKGGEGRWPKAKRVYCPVVKRSVKSRRCTRYRLSSNAYEVIMQKMLSIRDLMYGGQQIWIFRDLPPEVARCQAAFTPARKILCDKTGVKFGLLYP
ncbi:hypothetical protein ATANTOWER_023464, partial [Ataeniobius toweri]|nr:hypothetical protein [Ataeniobius toweri]